MTFDERAMSDVEGAESALGACQVVYEGTSASGDRLRCVTVSAIANHLDTLLKDTATFEEVITAVPSLASDLLIKIRKSSVLLSEAGEGDKCVAILVLCPKCKSRLRYTGSEKFERGTFGENISKWTHCEGNKYGCSYRPSKNDFELRLASQET